MDAEFDENIYFEGGYANQTGASPTSQPYIITLSNTTTADITSNIIGKAYENITDATNGINTGMTYTMGISGTTYVEFLYTTLNKAFVVGLSYVDASSHPSENINPARGLGGQSITRGYGNPNVVRQDKVVLGRGVANAIRGNGM